MGKPQAACGGVGDPIELAGGGVVQTADFEPPCPRNIAQNDARRRRATARRTRARFGRTPIGHHVCSRSGWSALPMLVDTDAPERAICAANDE